MTTPQELAERAAWFPAAARRRGASAAGDSGLAASGYLDALLPPEDRAALREINTRLTRLALEQCAAAGSVANQVDFGTSICVALAELAAHGVADGELIELSRGHDVVFPWSLAYGNARTPFNARLVRLPLAIAFPRTVDEVVVWVGWVRDHGLSVSIRSGTNSYEGLSSRNQVIIDLTFLALDGDDGAQFRIDGDAGVVHVAPGVRLGVLYPELDRAGFAFPGGQCAPVCVGGLVGTGGVGFSTRGYGFVCDQLVEVECVLADGSVVVANAGNEHAELYRACKGAGAAGLCVMTRLTLRLAPAGDVVVYAVLIDPADGAAAVAAWQNLADRAPETLSSVLAAPGATGGGGVITVIGEFRYGHGDPGRAERELRGLLHDEWLGRAELETPPEVLTAAMGMIDAAAVVASIVPMPTYNQWKLKSRFTFRPLAAAELAPVFDYLRTHAPSDDPTRAVGFLNPILLGGVSNRIDPESAVVPARDGAVMWVHFGAQWNDPSAEAGALAWVDGLWEVLDRALGSDTGFYNCPELELGSQLATPAEYGYLHTYWSGPSHDFVPFLVGVKNRYDPGDLFRGDQSIPLALPGS
jgi:hypothetical protein